MRWSGTRRSWNKMLWHGLHHEILRRLVIRQLSCESLRHEADTRESAAMRVRVPYLRVRERKGKVRPASVTCVELLREQRSCDVCICHERRTLREDRDDQGESRVGSCKSCMGAISNAVSSVPSRTLTHRETGSIHVEERRKVVDCTYQKHTHAVAYHT